MIMTQHDKFYTVRDISGDSDSPSMIAVLLILLLFSGCATNSPEPSYVPGMFEAAEQPHPKGARLSREAAMSLAAEALKRRGYSPEALLNAGAFYLGTERDLSGRTTKLWT